MEITAKAKFVRYSPRKVRLIIDAIRGLGVNEAERCLSVTRQWAAEPVMKLLKSAIANAEHNFKLSPENLFVKTITADSGPVYKRWTPKAFGRASRVRHRTAHLAIVLAEKEVREVAVKARKLKNNP